MNNIGKGIGRISNIILTKGKGSWVYTSDGKKLLDFTCGIGVTNLGHCHPKITEAVCKQASTLVHAQVNIGYHDKMIKLINKLLPIMPHTLDTFLFCTTGSEAIENAIKLARNATKKQNIIVLKGGFHGRTIGTMSLTTSKAIYRSGFGPLMSGITIVPYPYHIHGPISDPEMCSEWCLQELKFALKQQTTGNETAALLIEPILGEGGYVIPPKSYIEGIRKICSENSILLIADEVQCGFGRAGENFVMNDIFNVKPDIMVMAKGIANGYPLSGIVSTKNIMDTQNPGSMGGTYSGNAIACSAAIATQEVFIEERILENTRVLGNKLLSALKSISQSGKYPIIDVRGKGLMIGLEFDNKVVPSGTAIKLCRICLDNGLLLMQASIYEVIRFMPPLNINEKELYKGIDIFQKSIDQCFKQ